MLGDPKGPQQITTAAALIAFRAELARAGLPDQLIDQLTLVVADADVQHAGLAVAPPEDGTTAG